MESDQQGCVAVAPAQETQPRQAPLWHVVLLDDDAHTYEYVIEMLGRLFQHQTPRAYKMACEVDTHGSVIVETTVFERAEFKRDQIRAYGRDWRLEYSHGSMRAVLRTATESP